MKKRIASILAFGLMTLSGAAAALTPPPLMLATATPDSYSANGATSSGWTWLRGEGDFAEWVWAPVPGAPSRACLNLSFLVTNHANGGSGHDGTIGVQLVGDDGEVRTTTVTLKNPFRPIVEGNTGGTGYQTYGAFCLASLAELAPQGFRLRVEWSGAWKGHVAVRQDAALLAYTTGARPPDDGLR